MARIRHPGQWSSFWALGCLTLAACGGGGVSKTSVTQGLTPGTTTTVTGSPNITVSAGGASPASVDPAAPQLLQSDGSLNPVYTCPADTNHFNPPISWTQGPSDKTAYYVVIMDDPSQLAVNRALVVRWIARVSPNVLGIHSNLTSVSSGLNQTSSTLSLISNLYTPPYQSDGPHMYNVHVYAMSAAWLPDPTKAAGPGADFSNVSLPSLPSVTANGQVYNAGDPATGFEQAFAAYIVGSGTVSGNDLVLNDPAATGC